MKPIQFTVTAVIFCAALFVGVSVIQAQGGDPATAAVSADQAGESQIVASKRLLDIIRNGGPLMIPIGICSFVLLVFVFERFISLRKGRILPRQFAKRFVKNLADGELDRDNALELCDKNKSPIAKVFRAAIMKWGKPSVEVEQAVLDAGERAATDMRKYMRLLNGIATVCPLLGLLGTVLGMIHAFDAIATVNAAAVDPKVLIATGISQALLTTAAGMSVAIPALIASMYFSGRIDQRVIEIDSLGHKVVDLISAEALLAATTDRKNGARSKKTKAA